MVDKETGEVFPDLPFLRTAYNYDRNAVSDATGLECLDESMADQSQAEDADINVIVARFGITHELPVGLRVPQYGDYSQVMDFQSAMNAVRRAEETFMEMPAGLRARFGNDPQAFLEFCSDPSNQGEAEKMGLTLPKAVQLVSQDQGATPPTGSGANAPKGPAGAVAAPPPAGGAPGGAQGST